MGKISAQIWTKMAENRMSTYIVLKVYADTYASMTSQTLQGLHHIINKLIKIDIHSCTYVDGYRTSTAIYIICAHVQAHWSGNPLPVGNWHA